MTPLHIKMMLHYYTTAEPYSKYDENHANSPAVKEYRNWLIDHDMLKPVISESGFHVTERGMAYIDYLTSVPVPSTVYKVQMPE